jgi:hypothetical protein
MDKAKARQLSEAMQAHLASFATEHGLSISVGNGRYGSTDLTVKVELAELNADGQAETQKATDFKRAAEQYGLKPEDLGAEFNSGGQRFKITGAKLRAPKRPILCECVSAGKKHGKEFIFTDSAVCLALGRPAPSRLRW